MCHPSPTHVSFSFYAFHNGGSYIYIYRERERERERDANALGWWLCWMISRDLYLFRKIEIEIEIRGHGRHL